MIKEAVRGTTKRLNRANEDIFDIEAGLISLKNRNHSIPAEAHYEILRNSSGTHIGWEVFSNDSKTVKLYSENYTLNVAGKIMRVDEYYYDNGALYSHIVETRTYNAAGLKTRTRKEMMKDIQGV